MLANPIEQSEKQKSEEHNERVMNNMKQTAIQTEQKMRQIAGDIPKEISKGVSRHKGPYQ